MSDPIDKPVRYADDANLEPEERAAVDPPAAKGTELEPSKGTEPGKSTELPDEDDEFTSLTSQAREVLAFYQKAEALGYVHRGFEPDGPLCHPGSILSSGLIPSFTPVPGTRFEIDLRKDGTWTRFQLRTPRG